jgi:membrane-bound serine protease (ClpP class)
MPTLLALVLICVGIGFVAVEVHAPGFGGPGTAALVSFALAAMLLIDDRTSVRVPVGLIAAVGLVGIGLAGGVTVLAMRVRDVPHQAPSRVYGQVGVVISDLDPEGTVRVRAEEWTAMSESGPIPAGERVRVVGERGLRLRVDRLEG